MSAPIENSIARLLAGLDRDTLLAQAAADAEPVDEGNPAEWSVGDRDVGGAAVYSGTCRTYSVGGMVVYNEGHPKEAQAEHIAHQDPARILERYVPAMRKVIESYEGKAAEVETAVRDGDLTYAAYSEGYRDACLMFIRGLAAIYPDETTETEN